MEVGEVEEFGGDGGEEVGREEDSEMRFEGFIGFLTCWRGVNGGVFGQGVERTEEGVWECGIGYVH